jgi:imidazolonepropionase-like amidohydrolase
LTVTSPEDARQKVEQLLDDGADMVKIALETGVIFAQQIPTLSLEEALAIAAVVQEHKMRLSAHVTAQRELETALDIGVNDLAHMLLADLPPELIDRVIAADVYWVPTLELWKCVSEDNPVNFDAVAISNLEKFVAAGGMVALGTDYGGYTTRLGIGMPMDEIEMMQQAGMTAMQIIVSATRYAAHVCGLEYEIGTLETGKAADILVVNGDPLANIHALVDTRLVAREGVVIRQ